MWVVVELSITTIIEMKHKDLCQGRNQVQDLSHTVSWEREYQPLLGLTNLTVDKDKVKNKIGIREIVDTMTEGCRILDRRGQDRKGEESRG